MTDSTPPTRGPREKTLSFLREFARSYQPSNDEIIRGMLQCNPKLPAEC